MEAVWKRVRLPPAPNQRKVVMDKTLYYIGKSYRWDFGFRFRYVTAELGINDKWVFIKFWSEKPYFIPNERRWDAPRLFMLINTLTIERSKSPLTVTRDNQNTLIWDMEERPDGNSDVR